MSMKSSLLLLSALLFTLVSSHGYMARINDLGGSVVLNCTDDELHPGLTVTHWMEPRMFAILRPGDQAKGMEVSDDGLTLTIPAVTENHLGNYFCLMHRDAEPHYSRTTLYLYEPTFMDIYKTNLIIGLTAAGIFMVVSTVGCCVYVLKFEPNPDDYVMSSESYENGGYITSSLQELGAKKSYEVDTQF